MQYLYVRSYKLVSLSWSHYNSTDFQVIDSIKIFSFLAELALSVNMGILSNQGCCISKVVIIVVNVFISRTLIRTYNKHIVTLTGKIFLCNTHFHKNL